MAYPKELAERMDAIFEEYLYQGMEAEEKTKLQEELSVCAERTDGNRAVDIILQIEDQDREMLRGGNRHPPDYYNEVQKEAMKRLQRKILRNR